MTGPVPAGLAGSGGAAHTGQASARPLVRAGLRGFLDLGRVDLALVIGLTILAFVLRLGSPILPNFLGGATPQAPAIQILGVGAAKNSSPSACQHDIPYQGKSITACGQVFDEVYFPTDAAYDLASPPRSYFDPEPPLVKLLMTPSIAWLGYNTLGWRMTQVITGSLLVGLMYLIALRLRRDRFFAVVAALLVCLDGLAFVESRLGLIDIPALFFTALCWYFFLLHWQARTRRQWRITLYVTAAAMGLAFSAKLTALAPLAVLLVLVVGRALAPYAAAAFPALRRIAGPRRYETTLWREAAGKGAALHYAAGLLLIGVIFCASYSRYETIPHNDVYRFIACTPSSGPTTAAPPNDVYHLQVPLAEVAGVTVPNVPEAIQNIIDVNIASLRYQEIECRGHPWASRWYTWPISEHPVLMYYQNAPLLDNAAYQGVGIITNMGNPALWWLGLVALLFCVWRMTAGPNWLRAGVGAWLVVWLTTLILTFHAAEPAVIPPATYEIGPLNAVSPLFYVAFAAMLVFAIAAAVFAVISRRFVPAFIVLGYTAAWLMWMPGNKARVLFYYHALGMEIFTALALAYALALLRRVHFHAAGRWWSMAPLSYAGIACVVAAFLFFYPVWTAIPMTNADAYMRLWVDAW